MVIWSEYLKSISRLIDAVEKAEKELVAGEGPAVVFLGASIPLDDECGGLLGHLVNFEDSWWFEPNPEAFNDPRPEGKP